MIYSINDFPFCINDYKGVLAMNSVPTLLHFTYQRFCILYQCLLGYLNNEFSINDYSFCTNDYKGILAMIYANNDFLFCVNDSKGILAMIFYTNDLDHC